MTGYTQSSKNGRDLSATSIQFLTEKRGTINESITLDNLVKFNRESTGFYLVNYPEDHWNKLADKLLNEDGFALTQLTVNDRADLLLSSFLLTRAKLMPYMTSFKLFNYLVRENNYVPWYFFD